MEHDDEIEVEIEIEIEQILGVFEHLRGGLTAVATGPWPGGPKAGYLIGLLLSMITPTIMSTLIADQRMASVITVGHVNGV